MENVREDEILLDAMEQSDRAQQLRLISEKCSDDPALQQRVVELLDAATQPDSLLDQPVSLPPTKGTRCGETMDLSGRRIGDYKLLQQIGEGGFGVVYMAEQTKPLRRKVALKVIKPGMDSKEVSARFQAERQALAIMDHPNIAKVFDAGETFDGRAYFVMELVKGKPLTEYADGNNLSTAERLALFGDVCRAVHHAHQKGVIHRDLKPSNVMVTLHDGRPVPKVIDFGVAKALNQPLTQDTMFTRYGQVIGTPQYMSPEQAEMSGLDIDTRSDVYSLGVLLYELLTGRTPFTAEEIGQAGLEEMRRIIREREPQKPSLAIQTLDAQSASFIATHRSSQPESLRKMVRGELDWIVMKALEKDRKRRYDSANLFADDVDRYLNKDAVLATPPTVRYRLWKSYRRNRAAWLTGTAIAGSLLIALVSALVSLRQSRHQALVAVKLKSEAVMARDEMARQSEIASESANASKEVLSLLLNVLSKSQVNPVTEQEFTVREVLNELASASHVDSADVGWSADSKPGSFARIPPEFVAQLNLQMGRSFGRSGNTQQAETQLTSARKICVQVHGANHLETAKCERYLGYFTDDPGLIRSAIEKEMLADSKGALVSSRTRLAALMTRRGDLDTAESLLRQACQDYDPRLRVDELNEIPFMHLARLLRRKGELVGAAEAERHAVSVAKSIFNTKESWWLSKGRALRAEGVSEDAEYAFLVAAELQTNQDTDDAHYYLGFVYQELGEPELAAQHFGKSAQLNRGHQDSQRLSTVANELVNIAIRSPMSSGSEAALKEGLAGVMENQSAEASFIRMCRVATRIASKEQSLLGPVVMEFAEQLESRYADELGVSSDQLSVISTLTNCLLGNPRESQLAKVMGEQSEFKGAKALRISMVHALILNDLWAGLPASAIFQLIDDAIEIENRDVAADLFRIAFAKSKTDEEFTNQLSQLCDRLELAVGNENDSLDITSCRLLAIRDLLRGDHDEARRWLRSTNLTVSEVSKLTWRQIRKLGLCEEEIQVAKFWIQDREAKDEGVAYQIAYVGRSYYNVGDYEQAKDYLRRAIQVADENDHQSASAWCRLELAMVMKLSGQTKEAKAVMKEVLARADGLSGHGRLTMDFVQWMAKLSMGPRLASQVLDEMTPYRLELKDNSFFVIALAEAYELSGNVEDAVACYEEHAKRCYLNAQVPTRWVDERLIKLLTETGQIERAESLFRELLAIRMAKAGSLHPRVAFTQMHLAKLLIDHDKSNDEAIKLLKDARAILSHHPIVPDQFLSEIDRSLGHLQPTVAKR